MRKILILAASLVLAACQQQAAAPAKVDTAAATDAIGKLESAQIAAINSRDPAGATAVYGDNAAFITNSGLTNGKDAIATFFKGFLTDPNVKIDYTSGAKMFSDDGTLAYSTATYTESYTDPATKKPITVKGSNLSVWRKQADGSWKLVGDSNADSPTG
ncbi:MAG: nuclear transport factor 2 family protein [Pseudomonadota bacterium]